MRESLDAVGPRPPADAGVDGAAVSAEFVAAVLDATRLLVAVAERSLAAIEDDVTPQQYRAMALLAEQSPLGLTQLASALAIHQSTCSRLVDRLVQKGMIHRATAAASRREVAISLTGAGRTVVAQVDRHRELEVRAIGALLPPHLQQELTVALSALARAGGDSERSAPTAQG